MRLVKAALAVAGGLASLLLIRSLVEPYVLTEERYRVRVPNLPLDWEGEKIVLICDLHIGMVGGAPGTVRRAVRRAVAEKPAAVVVAGDFVHDNSEMIDEVVDMLRPLGEAGIPAYGVLGNHDYAMPTKDSTCDLRLAACLEHALEGAGIDVLHNEVVELKATAGGDPLYLVGVGSHTARDDDARRALAQLPGDDAPRLVMLHHPASFDQCPPYSAPLAIAGHTHGGQIRLPLAPILNYLTYVKELKVIVSGWIHSEGISSYGQEGNNLYVSRGLGCSVLPVRLFCPPEITIFTLNRGSPALA